MRRLFLIFLALGFILSSCFAETIQLKNGKVLTVRIIERTFDYIKVDFNGIPIKYYFENISFISEKNNARLLFRAKNAVEYKVTKKFYLKALKEVNFLKFCMPLPQKESTRQINLDIESFPQSNGFIDNKFGANIPIFYYNVIKSGKQLTIGYTYKVVIDTTPITIDRRNLPDKYRDLKRELTRYLIAEGDLAVDNERIKKVAESIVGSKINPYDKARSIYDYITRTITYDKERLNSRDNDNRSPLSTLDQRKGICYDITKLYVTLCRAVGVPARVVRGIAV